MILVVIIKIMTYINVTIIIVDLLHNVTYALGNAMVKLCCVL